LTYNGPSDEDKQEIAVVQAWFMHQSTACDMWVRFGIAVDREQGNLAWWRKKAWHYRLSHQLSITEP
jgi:hypothetical protein